VGGRGMSASCADPAKNVSVAKKRCQISHLLRPFDLSVHQDGPAAQFVSDTPTLIGGLPPSVGHIYVSAGI
jgi:hypothetical protein